MTKNELVEELCQQTDLTRSQAIKAIEGFMDIMKDTFVRHEEIYLRGFGTFQIVERKGKMARDIARGTTMVIPRHYALKFKPCKELKSKVQ